MVKKPKDWKAIVKKTRALVLLLESANKFWLFLSFSVLIKMEPQLQFYSLGEKRSKLCL